MSTFGAPLEPAAATARVQAAGRALHEALTPDVWPEDTPGTILMLLSVESTQGPGNAAMTLRPSSAHGLDDEAQRKAVVYGLAWHLWQMGDDRAEELIAESLALVRKQERQRRGPIGPRPTGSHRRRRGHG